MWPKSLAYPAPGGGAPLGGAGLRRNNGAMTRSTFEDSRFQHSSVPGWQPTAPDGAGAGMPAPSHPTGPQRPARAPQRRSLTDEAHVWLARLPPRFQPFATARRHPHIVNRMAELWAQPQALSAYFAELLLSGREDRQGFSFDVLTELFDLQSQARIPRRIDVSM